MLTRKPKLTLGGYPWVGVPGHVPEPPFAVIRTLEPLPLFEMNSTIALPKWHLVNPVPLPRRHVKPLARCRLLAQSDRVPVRVRLALTVSPAGEVGCDAGKRAGLS